MATDKLYIKEGTTSSIDMQLLADGKPIDLSTAAYIRLTMLDSLKSVYHYNSNDVSPAVTITTASDGDISFVPPNQTVFRYNKSPYKIVVWVYSSNGQRYACPEQGASLIYVEPEY
jgi:hypothetical protein